MPRATVETVAEGRFARFGLALAAWTERWFPDPLVFAFIGVLFVYVAGIAAGESPSNLALQAGKSFWALIPFTMQMVMVIVGGYVVAATPAVRSAIRTLAGVPKSPKSAVAMIALFGVLTSLLSWGLSLIFGGLLARETAQRVKGLDYRAAGAAGYLGLGTVSMLGLSSSPAMLMATKGSIPPALYQISGLIPLTQTLFLWQSGVTILVLMLASVLVAWLSAPSAQNAKTIEAFELRSEGCASEALEPPSRPGERLEHSPLLSLAVAAILAFYLVNVFATSPQGALAALDLNTYNLMFLTLAIVLHWRPKRFIRAVGDAIPATGGVIIQFPIYAMIFGMISNTGLAERLANFFAGISTHETYSLLVAAYSALLGMFIPSAGSKWVVEAPYVLRAAITNHVHLGWVVQIYNAAEALPNLLNPFWMLPLLGILKLRARDVVGYSALQFLTQTPLVLFLCWVFGRSLEFVAPVITK
jgi:short-chain fatty acids transporter